MQYTIKETTKAKVLKNSLVSIPETFSGKLAGKDIELDTCFCQSNVSENALIQVWNQQHPLIHTWLLLSFLSIGILYALFFVVL